MEEGRSTAEEEFAGERGFWVYASDARKEGRAMSLRMYNHAKRKEPDEVVDLLRNVSLSPSKKVRASTVRVA